MFGFFILNQEKIIGVSICEFSLLYEKNVAFVLEKKRACYHVHEVPVRLSWLSGELRCSMTFLAG